MWKDRKEAAEKLLFLLKAYENDPNVIVVSLPRGGVVLGRVIADALKAPLDLVIPRKIGMPGDEECAIGALAETGDIVWNEVERKRVSDEAIAPVIEKEKKEQARRLALYRGSMPPRDWTGKTVILVDDGIATGFTMLAGIASARKFHPKKVIVAVPVMPPSSMDPIKAKAEEVIALKLPRFLGSIGAFFGDFRQVNDDQVRNLMHLV